MNLKPVELDNFRYARPETWTNAELIDSDVHIAPPTTNELSSYLNARWRDYIRESGINGLDSGLYPERAPNVFLPGSRPPAGSPGSSLDLLQAQLLEPWETTLAIINSTVGIDSLHNDDLAAALATATNQWQLEHWLQADLRLRGSAVLPVQNPQLAAAEVDRIARHSEYVQVVLPVRSREPLGRRGYWPIYEAAQRAGMVVAIQAGGVSGNPITPVGWPTYYLEDYVALSQAFQGQVLSLVSEGVFAEFPDLRVVLLESGFTWLPSLMWRFDKNWKGLRREVPWVADYPSDVIRKSIRITTQPLDAPSASTPLLETIDQIESDELLMFATDYPHLQFTTDNQILPSGIAEDKLTKIFSGNARATYRF